MAGFVQNGVMAPGGIEAETEQALKNLTAVVEAGGSTMENVLKVRRLGAGRSTAQWRGAAAGGPRPVGSRASEWADCTAVLTFVASCLSLSSDDRVPDDHGQLRQGQRGLRQVLHQEPAGALLLRSVGREGGRSDRAGGC